MGMPEIIDGATENRKLRLEVARLATNIAMTGMASFNKAYRDLYDVVVRNKLPEAEN